MNDPVVNALLRQDPSAFVHKVFQTLSPGQQYIPTWHTEAIAHQLARLYNGDNQRLLITQPPRTLKSICTSVAFVAWALGHDPSLSFICVSYSQDLALDLARKFRFVVSSDWYRALFPNMHLDRDTEAQILTTLGGGRSATSIGGTLTGRGADIIIIDDPLKAEEAQSETARSRVIDWFTDSLLSRFNDQRTGRLIVVMQRLHEEDLAGHIAPTCFHLDLPAIAIEPQEIALSPGRIHVREVGDLLDPVRLPQSVLDRMKSEIGSFAFSAQYQQRPTPVEGNLVKLEWFGRFDVLPDGEEYKRTVQSWDVAGSMNGDYSVCTTWVIIGKNAYLTEVWRGRLEFPALRKKAIALAQQHRAPTILVERAGLGLSLYQDLQKEPAIGDVIGIDPKGDKVARFEGETPAIEGRYIFLPQDAPWLADYLHELLGFPGGRYDDQVDSTSQFLGWRRRRDIRTGPRASGIDLGPKLFGPNGRIYG